MFALGAATLTMAVVFFVASFVHEDLSNGDAGTQLARIFAATLTLSSVFLFLLGMLLLRADRNKLEHYLLPLAVGAAIGLVESWMFLDPRSPVLLLAPLLLLILLLRPIRRRFSGMFQGNGARR